jgi:hypothetical protein
MVCHRAAHQVRWASAVPPERVSEAPRPIGSANDGRLKDPFP